MFSIASRCAITILCLAVGIGASRTAVAQHHGGHHGSSHHGSSHGFSHHGSSHYGSSHHGWFSHGGYHSGWGHVVPSHHHHSGLYYSYGGANYYTPVMPPVPVQVFRPQAGGNLAVIAPPADPIAPQSVQLEFGGFRQIEDLSGRLVIEANLWCLDMHYNYSHNPDFATTYRDAYQVLLTAKSVQAAVGQGNRESIRNQIAAAEPLFHQVQERMKTWTREERRSVGDGGFSAKASVVESILHHLLYDVGITPQHSPMPEEQAPPPAEPIGPPVLKTPSGQT